MALNNQTPNDSPPSYDYIQSGYNSGDKSKLSHPADPPKAIPNQQPLAVYNAGPSYTANQPLLRPSPTIYHYTNPRTGEHVDSLLPPDHPEMICLQAGQHDPETKFGLLGILAAVFWFPLGIGLCLLDRRVRCRRCGYMIDDGVC